jgi:hypothetical protein
MPATPPPMLVGGGFEGTPTEALTTTSGRAMEDRHGDRRRRLIDGEALEREEAR